MTSQGIFCQVASAWYLVSFLSGPCTFRVSDSVGFATERSETWYFSEDSSAKWLFQLVVYIKFKVSDVESSALDPGAYFEAAVRTKRREPWMLGDEITQNMRDQAWHVVYRMASNANGSGFVRGQCAISDDAVLVLQGSRGQILDGGVEIQLTM